MPPSIDHAAGEVVYTYHHHQVSSSKRKQPTDGLLDDRLGKRRSAQACLCCRNRKVRCDAVRGGVPCTNCRLDSVECIITSSNRGRRRRGSGGLSATAAARSPSPPPPQSPSPSPSPYASPASQPDDNYSPATSSEHHSPSPPGPDERTGEFLVSLTFEDQLRISRAPEILDETRAPTSDTQPPISSATALATSPDVSCPLEAFGQWLSSSSSQQQPLPSYIKPLPSHIGGDDVDYLTKKGAMAIPDTNLRNELLRSYVQFVHPFLPVLDLAEFLRPIANHGGGPSGSISILLFQAVMFVSITFVDIQYLIQRGYPSRKTARKIFFRRVRLLYGLDIDPDRISLIQTLLLMTYWYDGPDDEKDTWHWMGIAHSLAQNAGLNRDPANMNITPAARRLRRRIWWSCFMRDRLLALGIRRPARIRNEDFSVPMLTPDDFDIPLLSEDLIGFLGELPVIGDSDAQRSLAVACIELAKLCICIGNVLISQFSVVGNHPVGNAYVSSPSDVPRIANEKPQDISKYDSELGDWRKNLPMVCRFVATPSTVPRVWNDVQGIVRLHQASLHLMHLTALGALHRPRLFQACQTPSTIDADRRVSRQKVTEAAVAITEIAYDLHVHDQLRHLSTTSIPAFVSAVLIHLLDIQSAKEEVRNLSVGRFYQCMEALHQLQDMYMSADYAVCFLETLLQNINLQIPMMRLCQRPLEAMPPSIAAIFSTCKINSVPTGQPLPSSSGRVSQLNDDPITHSMVSNLEGRPPFVYSNLQSTSNATSNIHPNTAQSQQRFSDSQAAAVRPPLSTPFSDWNETEGILPALINFDIDPAAAMVPTAGNPNAAWGYLDLQMNSGHQQPLCDTTTAVPLSVWM